MGKRFSSRSPSRNRSTRTRRPKAKNAHPDKSGQPLQLVLHMDPPRAASPPLPARRAAEHRVVVHDTPPSKAELAAGTDEVLTTREVVRITKRHRATLFRWERSGHFPPKRTFKGGKRGWLRSDVEQWMAGEKATDTNLPRNDMH